MRARARKARGEGGTVRHHPPAVPISSQACLPLLDNPPPRRHQGSVGVRDLLLGP